MFCLTAYFGRDVGLGLGRAAAGRAAGRDGLPQAPQALMLSFILIYYFIGLYLPILIIDYRVKVSHRPANEWGFVFMGCRKRILIDYILRRCRQFVSSIQAID